MRPGLKHLVYKRLTRLGIEFNHNAPEIGKLAGRQPALAYPILIL